MFSIAFRHLILVGGDALVINVTTCYWLENEIMSMCSSNKYVIMSGDVNARTGKLTDYVKLDNYFSDMFDFDDEIANFFDKTEMLENLNIPLTSRDYEGDCRTSVAMRFICNLLPRFGITFCHENGSCQT